MANVSTIVSLMVRLTINFVMAQAFYTDMLD